MENTPTYFPSQSENKNESLTVDLTKLVSFPWQAFWGKSNIFYKVLICSISAPL